MQEVVVKETEIKTT